jgi:hypothetical protein
MHNKTATRTTRSNATSNHLVAATYSNQRAKKPVSHEPSAISFQNRISSDFGFSVEEKHFRA